MTTTTKRTKLANKRLLMYGAIVGAAAILLTASVGSGVLAQSVSNASKNATIGTTTSPNQSNNLPNIAGSIPLRATISGALSSKVKTSLSDAIGIAQKSVGTNTSSTLGLLRPLNGYLVYDVHVKNNANNTTYAVIVDPGSGKILYKQALPSLVGGGVGHFGMFGRGKMGPWSGGYGAGGYGRGFGDHGGMMMGQSLHMGPMGSIPPRAW
ncbi:MAG: PepSY domain-containing protein [Nitrososphaeraceae archaeon]